LSFKQSTYVAGIAYWHISVVNAGNNNDVTVALINYFYTGKQALACNLPIKQQFKATLELYEKARLKRQQLRKPCAR